MTVIFTFGIIVLRAMPVVIDRGIKKPEYFLLLFHAISFGFLVLLINTRIILIMVQWSRDDYDNLA